MLAILQTYQVASNKAVARSNTALIILNTTKSDSKDIQKRKKREQGAESREQSAPTNNGNRLEPDKSV